MARTRDEFLQDCDAEDRSAYESLFEDVNNLARELGDPDPSDETSLTKPLDGVPLRLRISFGDPKGPSLRLAHVKLGGVAPLLWFFPSQNEERWTAVNRVSALLAQLPKAGVKDADAMTYGNNLKKAGFVSSPRPAGAISISDQALIPSAAESAAATAPPSEWPTSAARAMPSASIRSTICRLQRS